MRHLPLLWRFRVLRGIKGKGSGENRRFLGAWQLAEGGTAAFNPLNTTEPWAGATNYNSVGVKNYRTGSDGIAATVATLLNGHYTNIVHDLRDGTLPAEMIVKRNDAEIRVWGTNPNTILAVLATRHGVPRDGTV